MSTPETRKRLGCDRAEITRALGVLFTQGDIVELRVLEARTPAYRAPHVESGYFDTSEKLADAAAAISEAKGFYVCMNPCKPDLIARANNRIKPVGKNPLTSDGDILRRRWLLVDTDPVRTVGISSSEEEHQLALNFARTLAERLRVDHGWPDPIIGDSGNGCHLYYKIDLPADDDGLVQRVLAGLAERFGGLSDAVKVDQSVFNASRITKLFGTIAAKGDSTPKRPHRMARLLEVPETINVVSVDLLETIAVAKPEARQEQHHNGTGQHTGKGHFDLDAWIARHNLRVGEPKDWHGGRRWVFDVCPWDSAHTDASAFLAQRAEGAIVAGCQHNSCRSKTWHDLRELVEGPREHRRCQHTPGNDRRDDRQGEQHEPRKLTGITIAELGAGEYPAVFTHVGLLFNEPPRKRVALHLVFRQHHPGCYIIMKWKCKG